MGSLKQQVNLYQRQAQVAPDAFSTHALMATLGLGVAILLVAWAVTAYQIHELEDEYQQTSRNLQATNQQLAQLKSRLPTVQPDPFLQSELTNLQASQTRLNHMIALISQQQSHSKQGFADYFRALARNTLDGLWLRDLQVSAGGEDLLLKGKALEPELVPRLLQKLVREPAFAGRSFREVRFQRASKEQGSPMSFELRSRSVSKGG